MGNVQGIAAAAAAAEAAAQIAAANAAAAAAAVREAAAVVLATEKAKETETRGDIIVEGPSRRVTLEAGGGGADAEAANKVALTESEEIIEEVRALCDRVLVSPQLCMQIKPLRTVGVPP